MADTNPTDAAPPDAIYQLLIAARQLLYQADTLADLDDDTVTGYQIDKAVRAVSASIDTRIFREPTVRTETLTEAMVGTHSADSGAID